MSIEKTLAELTEAVRENTELLKFMTSHARDGASKPSTKAAAKSDDEGEEEKPARRTRTTKPKEPTAKELAAATTSYLEVDDEDEYEKRKGIVKKITAKFDVQKMSLIPDGDRTEAMELLQKAIDGKNPFARKRDEDDEDMA